MYHDFKFQVIIFFCCDLVVFWNLWVFWFWWGCKAAVHHFLYPIVHKIILFFWEKLFAYFFKIPQLCLNDRFAHDQLLYSTFIYLFHLSEIICLNTFLKFFSFIYMTSKAKYLTQSCWIPQKASAVLYATSFYNFKISTSNGLASLFRENDFSLRKKLSSTKKSGFQGLY